MSQRAHSKNSQVREVKEFEEEVLQIDRVTRVVKGGRRLRFRATVIIGNRKGKVGVGVGKSEEVVGAIQKAVADAKKSLITVTMNGTTVPHEVKVKYKSAVVLLLPASEGTGIIAGGPIRKIVALAGIKNILSKSFGTTNKIASARATINALSLMKKTPFSKKAEFDLPKPEPKREENNTGRKPFFKKPMPGVNKTPVEAKPAPAKPEAPKAKETQTPAPAKAEASNK